MLTEGRNPLSQRVSECRRARGRGGVQSGLRSSSLPSWCLSCCGNVYVGAGDKGPLSPYFSFIHRSAWKENSAKFAWPQQNTCERGNTGAPGRTKKWPELCIAHDSFRETMWREKPELPCEEPRFGWCATRRNLEEGDVGLCISYLPAHGPPKRALACSIAGTSWDLPQTFCAEKSLICGMRSGPPGHYNLFKRLV